MEYDLAIIGGGPAGYPCAHRATALGLKVVLIEKRPYLGGTCLHEGCIPSKALLAATALLSDVKASAIIQGKVSIDKEALVKQKSTTIERLAKGLDSLQIKRITGHATCVDAHTISIAQEGKEERITAHNIVLATGSTPIAFPDLPFDEETILSSTGALEMASIPKKLVVIGAGVIGIELASVYQRLGSQVILIELLPTLCAGFDSSLRRGLLECLQKQGLEFFFQTKVERIEHTKAGVSVYTQSEKERKEHRCDKVLVAIGRKPNSSQLGLENIGVEILQSGHVKINSQYQTSVPSVYAVGDLVTGPMLAHRATEEGIALAEYFAKMVSEVDMIAIPNVIYTDPEVASCGFSEDELQGSVPLKIGSCPLRINGRAVASGHETGFVKVIAHKQTDRLLGVHIFAKHASEMIAVASLALHMKAKLRDLATLPFAHPTISEAIKEAACQAH